FQAEDGIRDGHVTGVQTCALPISRTRLHAQPGQGRGRVTAGRPLLTPPRHEKSVRKTDAKPAGSLLYFPVGFLFQAPRNQDPTSSPRRSNLPELPNVCPSSGWGRLGRGAPADRP